jgi:O-antigen ligase
VRGATLSAGAIVALAAADGGFAPSAWRVGTVLLGALGCILALWTTAPTRRAATSVVLVTLLGGLVGLSLASSLWSVDPSASLLDAQRSLLYLTALTSFVLAGDGLVAGVGIAASAVCGWALVQRAVSGTTVDPYEGRLLTGAMGYANGLGALAAAGIAIYVILAVRERRALMSAPLLVLVPALALTGSRGSVAAVVVGAGVGLPLLAGRRVLAGAIAGVTACMLTIFLVFTPAFAGDRALYWHGARSIIAAHPFGGTGAGTFGLVRYQAPYARDAHSLFLQAFSELGVVGLVLVVSLFAVPLVAAIRRTAAAPAAGIAVLAFHTGIDWDWQLPAVTVAALALAAAAGASADPVEPPRTTRVSSPR